MDTMSARYRLQGARLASSLLIMSTIVFFPAIAEASPLPDSPSATNADDEVFAVEVSKLPAEGSSQTARSKDATSVAIKVTSYMPAPGVSVAELHQKLKSEGVPGLVDPATGVKEAIKKTASEIVPTGYPPEPRGGCQYGTSSTDGCPPAVWARNIWANPRVYFYDTSDSTWPVGTEINVWNQSPKIAPRWAPGGCPSVLGSHCVSVVSGGYGNSGWVGSTTMYINPNTNFFVDTYYNGIKFNAYYPSVHANIACHEIGHVFGVGHSTSKGSCMYAYQGTVTSPDSMDFWVVANVLYPN